MGKEVMIEYRSLKRAVTELMAMNLEQDKERLKQSYMQQHIKSIDVEIRKGSENLEDVSVTFVH